MHSNILCVVWHESDLESKGSCHFYLRWEKNKTHCTWTIETKTAVKTVLGWTMKQKYKTNHLKWSQRRNIMFPYKAVYVAEDRQERRMELHGFGVLNPTKHSTGGSF